MEINNEVKSRAEVWFRRLLWTIHYNLIALGLISSYGIYRVIWAGDQITYTSADSLTQSETVGESQLVKQLRRK